LRATPLNLLPPGNITRVLSKSEKRQQLHSLALELGYAVTPLQKILKEIGVSVATRMRTRTASDASQTAAYYISGSWPREAMDQIFPRSLVTMNSSSTRTWTAGTCQEILLLLGPALAASDYACAGITRGFKTESEMVIRTVATLLPSVEISHVELARGIDRLYINFQYMMADGTGELHSPKDGCRNEIALSTELETQMREHILTDTREMAEKGFDLSPSVKLNKVYEPIPKTSHKGFPIQYTVQHE